MTVVSTVVRAAAAWTGAETEIPTGIQVQERSQLVVSLMPDDGERLALSLGLHYAITLSPAGVATIVPLAAFPPAAGTVSMVRQTPMTQVYDPSATDTYDAAGHAAALDRSAMRVAELSQKVDDIEASSIVVAGGAASVPKGAAYISDGEGGAVAGPTAAEIEAARIEAVAAAGTATGAASVAAGAATTAGQAAGLADELANAAPGTPVGSGYSARHWVAVAQDLSDALDLDNYSTTAEIAALLESYVPATRAIASGLGVKINGGDSATLAGTVTVGLDLATDAETVAGEIGTKPTPPSGVHAAIAAALAGLSTVEPGVIGYTAEQNPPEGWLERNGAAISRTAYAALFAKIGTTFGAGDGVTTFNLPDARGTFDRGWDHGRGLDPGRVFGSYQADEFKSHTHPVTFGGNDSGSRIGMGSNSASYPGSVNAAGGAETRPKNGAYLPIIKY